MQAWAAAGRLTKSPEERSSLQKGEGKVHVRERGIGVSFRGRELGGPICRAEQGATLLRGSLDGDGACHRGAELSASVVLVTVARRHDSRPNRAAACGIP